MAFSRTTLLAFMVALAVLPSSAANAQGIPSAASPLQDGEEVRGDPRVAVINEVERGMWFSVDVGPNYFFNIQQPDFVRLNQNNLQIGQRVGVRAGYDILNNISLDAFVLGNFNRGVLDEKAVLAGRLTGDLAHLSFGGGLRFSYITLDRFFAFVRVGGGYALWFPKELANNKSGSIHTDVSTGIEYYTRLRHLSIGLEIDGQVLWAPQAIGLLFYPTVKYTF